MKNKAQKQHFNYNFVISSCLYLLLWVKKFIV